MKYFVAIDWGSSNLRAFHIVDDVLQDTYAEERGVKKIDSPSQYLTIIQSILQTFSITDKNTPIILSGMVGSTAGWVNTGYLSCPVKVGDLGKSMEVNMELENPIYLCKGISLCDESKAEYDVMRGEEIQVLGALSQKPYDVIILPGTHSKWCHIKYSQEHSELTTFSTYMTGELHEVLSTQTLLCSPSCEPIFSKESFLSGVDKSLSSPSIIQALFSARARSVLGYIEEPFASSYISGLLIGHEVYTELKKLSAQTQCALIASEKLRDLYKLAAEHLQLVPINYLDAEEISIAGYRSLLRQL